MLALERVETGPVIERVLELLRSCDGALMMLGQLLLKFRRQRLRQQ